MNPVAAMMAERISSGLQRKSVTTCSRYAEQYRVMGRPFPGPWTFNHHAWSKEMHDADESWCGMKAAQMAFTETALNRVFFKVDIERADCLYVLPSKSPDASDFSSARFDAALDLSPHLENLFSDVKNVGHKRAGAVNLYIRGARSRSGLKSIPAGDITFDEVDEMSADNVVLAEERASGQVVKQLKYISTPTVDDFGIHVRYKKSSQEYFVFKCPACGRWIELIFPESLIVTAEDINDANIARSHLICHECKAALNHAAKIDWLSLAAGAHWEKSVTNKDFRGFQINQMYSATVSPPELAASYLRSLINPAEEQEFHNSKLGLPHTVEGARISDADLTNTIGTHRNGDTLAPSGSIVTIGIDVGNWIHYEVDAYNLQGTSNDVNTSADCKLLEQGKVAHFEELDRLFMRWRPRCAVIDANPEKRKALELAHRFPGLVYLCYYGNNVRGRDIVQHDELIEPRVVVDRSSWLDMSLGRFHSRSIHTPVDMSLEYKSHVKALVRIYEKDATGNPTARYVNTGPDHFGHARNYSEIALALGATMAPVQNMSESPV